MSEWHLIVLMAAVTYLPRYLPMAMAGHLTLSPAIARALDFVPIAVLTGIVAQNAFVREGAVALHWENYYAVAAIVAFAVGLYFKKLFWTILAGLSTFAVLRLFG